MIEAVSSDKRNLTFLNDENVEKAKLWHKREDLITVGVVTYSQNFLLKTFLPV